MHVEIDHQRAARATVRAQRTDRDDHVVDDAIALAVAVARMVGAAGKVRGHAVPKRVPRGQQRAHRGTPAATDEGGTPWKSEAPNRRGVKRAVAERVEVLARVGQRKEVPFRLGRRHHVARRGQPLAQQDVPQKDELPHREGVPRREVDHVIVVKRAAHGGQ